MCAYDFDMPDVIMKSRLAMLRIVGVLMLMVVLVLGGIGIYMRDKLVYNYWDKQRTKIGSIMKVSGYTIDRGDLVMIDIEGHRYLQRIVGLPGDSIQIKNGILYINGSEFDTKDIEVDSMSFSGTVPEKEYYVLDDRSFLYDSGRFDIRFMPECLIRGVEVFSYKVK
ncbi:putative signal peptidase I S [Coprococcus eutactus CAG:665]|nr:putative signal peptidase I S [Coprococcus eutactus CAG:665]